MQKPATTQEQLAALIVERVNAREPEKIDRRVSGRHFHRFIWT